MREQLQALRRCMKVHHIDIYIIPTTDYHGSEYVNDYFKCREYISGFTGSAGTLIVTQDFAGLWTDGRYFIQAKEQLKGTGIKLMKMGAADVPEPEKYLESQPEGLTVGFDGKVMDFKMGEKLEKKFIVEYRVDLVNEIWEKRPELIPSGIKALGIETAGETTGSKLRRLREHLDGADYMLIGRLEEIAWLYNMRGSDIEGTPVFYSFALISADTDILYVKNGALKEFHSLDTVDIHNKADSLNAKDAPADSLNTKDAPAEIREYETVFEDLKSLKNCTIMLDENTVSYALVKGLDSSVNKIICKSPVEAMKAVKNRTEIEATKQAHIRDGAAMVKFISWLKGTMIKCSADLSTDIDDPACLKSGDRGKITEISAAEYLENCRRQQGAYELSFDTIAAYEAHGAIVHYSATKESNVILRPEGFLLVDSGGQYCDGTTDITRTIALGAVNGERKRNYTAVLKGNIALARVRFAKGTTGAQLDEIAREPLHDVGLDFAHGTGHGVGHLLGVHEGPNVISPRGTDSLILPGMITTDEPGVYIEGEYGIRIENELLCMESTEMPETLTDYRSEVGTNVPECFFHELTLCPFERDAIDVDMLTQDEIEYIDKYHGRVYEELTPLLDDETAEWLKEACRPLR